MGSSPVVMRGVLGQDGVEVAFAEDQHPVGDLGPNGEDEPFRIGVRARGSAAFRAGPGSARRGPRGRPGRAGAANWRGAAPRPRAAAPAVRRSWTPASGRSGQASHRAGRRSDRAGEGTRLIIMAHCWPCRIAAAHRMGRLLPPQIRCSIEVKELDAAQVGPVEGGSRAASAAAVMMGASTCPVAGDGRRRRRWRAH